jgi:hypothetical protein
MVLPIRSLLFLILLWSNPIYAWYCTYVPTAQGWVSNLQCYGIDDATALTTAWCPYRPDDPICAPYIQPVCTDTVEYQSLSCPLPHYSGVVNQSRSYACSSSTWSSWTTTSDNCTQDPPTCFETTEQRTLACEAGYTGSILEQRTSTCSDPYSTPAFGSWIQVTNSCVKSMDNPTNPISPTSPLSVTSPLNPINAPVIPIEPVIVPMDFAQTQMPVETTSARQETKTEVKTESRQESQPASRTTASTEAKLDPKQELPKSKELVPGFGIVMSMQMLTQAYTIQNQQIIEAINMEQENDYAREQEVYFKLILADDIGDNLISASSYQWSSLLRDNPIQRFDFDN